MKGSASRSRTEGPLNPLFCRELIRRIVSERSGATRRIDTRSDQPPSSVAIAWPIPSDARGLSPAKARPIRAMTKAATFTPPAYRQSCYAAAMLDLLRAAIGFALAGWFAWIAYDGTSWHRWLLLAAALVTAWSSVDQVRSGIRRLRGRPPGPR
jgi:hypothetical protein